MKQKMINIFFSGILVLLVLMGIAFAVSIGFAVLYGLVVYVLPAIIFFALLLYALYSAAIIFFSLPFLPIVFLIGLLARERSVAFTRARDLLVSLSAYLLVADTMNFSLSSLLLLANFGDVNGIREVLPGLVGVVLIVLYLHYCRLIYMDGLKVALPLNFNQSYWELLKWPPASAIAVVFDFLTPSALVASYATNHWLSIKDLAMKLAETLRKSAEAWISTYKQYEASFLDASSDAPRILEVYWLAFNGTLSSIYAYFIDIAGWWYADLL